MTVLVDIGNTRIKWATARRRQARAPRQRRASRLARRRRRGVRSARCRRARASSPRTWPASASRAQLADARRARVPGTSLEFVATTAERFGVRCAYYGPDAARRRSLGGRARGASRRARRRCASSTPAPPSRSTPSTRRGTHLGGLIFAGARLLGGGARSQHQQHRRHGRGRRRRARARAARHAAPTRPSGNGAMARARRRARPRRRDRRRGARRAPPGRTSRAAMRRQLRGWLETSVELRADLVLEGLRLFAERGRGLMRNLFLVLVLANLAFAAWHTWFAPSARAGRPADDGLPALTLVSEVPVDLQAAASVAADDDPPAPNRSPGNARSTPPRTRRRAAELEPMRRAARRRRSRGCAAAAPPKSKPRCTSVGPFRELSQAAAAAATLRGAGYQPTAARRRRRGLERLLGLHPGDPDRSRKRTRRSRKSARARARIPDAYVIRNSDSGNLVSLGVFSEISGVSRLRDEVRALGFEPQVVDRMTPRDRLLDRHRARARTQTLDFDALQPPGRIIRLEQRAMRLSSGLQRRLAQAGFLQRGPALAATAVSCFRCLPRSSQGAKHEIRESGDMDVGAVRALAAWPRWRRRWGRASDAHAYAFLAAPARPAEDKERDAVWPLETVQFLGIKSGKRSST